MITIILVFFSFLIWNVANETLVGVEDVHNKNKWHIYDAIFRIILFTILAIDKFGITFLAIKIVIGCLLFYHVFFDLAYNIRRTKQAKLSINLYRLFYLGSNTLDRIIIQIGEFVKLDFIYINILIKFTELILALWMLLSN